MILTIWRHGQAGAAARDRDRELTRRGVEDIGFGGTRFRLCCEQRAIAMPDIILYSRWMRTAQTAAILGNLFPDALCEPCEALIPGSRSPGVDDELQRRIDTAGPGHLLLVSHQPLVSGLVDHYLDNPGVVAPLVPGGFATLDIDVAAAGCGHFRFGAQPPHYEAQA